MKSFFFFLSFLVYGMFNAQDARDVLKKMQEFYASCSEFEVSATYELFKGNKSNTVEESYEGFYQKSKEGFYQKIDETECIATGDFFLAISHPEQIMVLEKSKKIAMNDLNLETSLKHCKSLEVKQEEKNYIVLMYFSIDSGLPFSLVKITIDKKSYELKVLDLYYAEEIDFSKRISSQDMQQAHLRIKNRDFSKKIKKDDKRYQLSSYLTGNNGEATPSETCKGYELVDKRTKK